MTRLLCVGMYVCLSMPWMVEVLEVRESSEERNLLCVLEMFCIVVLLVMINHPASTFPQ